MSAACARCGRHHADEPLRYVGRGAELEKPDAPSICARVLDKEIHALVTLAPDKVAAKRVAADALAAYVARLLTKPPPL